MSIKSKICLINHFFISTFFSWNIIFYFLNNTTNNNTYYHSSKCFKIFQNILSRDLFFRVFIENLRVFKLICHFLVTSILVCLVCGIVLPLIYRSNRRAQRSMESVRWIVIRRPRVFFFFFFFFLFCFLFLLSTLLEWFSFWLAVEPACTLRSTFIGGWPLTFHRRSSSRSASSSYYSSLWHKNWAYQNSW